MSRYRKEFSKETLERSGHRCESALVCSLADIGCNRELRMSAPDAAPALRLPYGTYKGHENGNRGGESNAVRYAQFFRCDLRWLLTARGTMHGPPIQRVFDGLNDTEQQEVLNYAEFVKNRRKKV